jgi:hypothetical protein
LPSNLPGDSKIFFDWKNINNSIQQNESGEERAPIVLWWWKVGKKTGNRPSNYGPIEWADSISDTVASSNSSSFFFFTQWWNHFNR